MLKKSFFLLSLAGLFSLQTASAQSYNGPESVEFDSTTSCYYISNTNTQQIIKRNPNGTLQVFATLTGTGPHGLEIAAGKLFACNGASVKVLNLSTGAIISNITITGASFLNGITHVDNGSVYVTDFSAKKIYRINPITYTYNVFVANTTQTPNGIIYDFVNNRLVYGTWGTAARVKAVSLADSTQTNLITTTLSNIDGICIDSLANIFVSNWGSNSLVMLQAPNYSAPVTLLTGLSSPADICYNFRGDTIAIPNSGNNTVTFYHSLITSVQESSPKEAPKATVGSTCFSVSAPSALRCFSSTGNMLQSQTLAPGNYTWPFYPMPSGLYLLSIESSGQKQKTFRVAIP